MWWFFSFSVNLVGHVCLTDVIQLYVLPFNNNHYQTNSEVLNNSPYPQGNLHVSRDIYICFLIVIENVPTKHGL